MIVWTKVLYQGCLMFSKDQKNLLVPLLYYLVVDGIMSSFTRGQREYLFAITSKENDCAYCYNKHMKWAIKQGVTEDEKLEIMNASGTEIETIKAFAKFANSLVKYNEEHLWK
jgi:AhpD family alkylhydroperoxidase